MEERIVNYQKILKKNINLLVNQNKIEEAKRLLTQYENIKRDDIDIYSIKAVIAMIEGDMDKAEMLLVDGLEKDGSNFDILYNLGYLYESKGDISQSLRYYAIAELSVETHEQDREIKEKINIINAEHENNTIKKDLVRNRDKESGITHQNVKITKHFNNKLDRQTLKLFKNKEFNKIIQEIQEKARKREYSEVIAICDYWLTRIDKNTAIINYFMAVSANGIKDFSSSLEYHIKALEADGTLADLRYRKSKYKYNYEEENTCCIGCGNENFEVVNISNQSISEDNKELINPIRIWVKCSECDLIYANPIPSENSLNRYYSLIAKEKFGGIYGNIDDRFEFLVSLANKRLEKIELYNKGEKTLLDIGTGIGVFTGIALDRGWKAEGLELTSEDCEYAKEKFDLNLKQENFYSFSEDKKYDVVTLFEVIEHLQNPLKDLKQINKLVKDKGILVLATPIQDTLYGKKMKENNVFWNVVTHLSYFTKNVMLNYLKESGFEVLEISASMEGMGRMEFYCRKI